MEEKKTGVAAGPDKLAPSELNSALRDYGKLYSGATPYLQIIPSTLEELKHTISDCAQSGRSIRVRGSGHTFNGCTLPRDNELLIRTHQLDWYNCEKRSTLTVGGGALVWDIRDFAAQIQHQMPVYNGGWAGPSIAGYICAGGFGKGSLSDAHGGLWENVLSIDLIDGSGELHHINREDPRFRWIFGCYGQLGVIAQVTLKLLPDSAAAMFNYPKHSQGRIPRQQEDDPAENDLAPGIAERKLFWFSMLISLDQEELAWSEMLAFCRRHPGVVQPDGGWAGPIENDEHIGYRYDIRFKKFTPPLLYDRDEDFIVMGVMSFMDVSTSQARADILDVETDFIDLANRNNFKLYLQAENIGRNIDYQRYYGDSVYNEFQQLKTTLDPAGIVNPGLIFTTPNH